MKRRDFLKTAGAALPAGIALSHATKLLAGRAQEWRTFEITTRIEVRNPSGATRIWAPMALSRETPYQKTLANSFQCEGGRARKIESKADSLEMIAAEFPAGIKPVLTTTSRVATRDRTVDFAASRGRSVAKPGDLTYFLRSTKYLPTDGIVKDTALRITKNSPDDVGKARAIYEWIVENTYRNPKTRGCGLGNIKFMLESGDLGGKCADLNALFVGLARAAGLPARDVYGIRVAKSHLGYTSLGASSDHITKSQHCRAEVYLGDYGWVAVDPADVRKVILEEPPGNLPIDNEQVKRARARLFGSWEMNWMAYNFAHDVALPGSSGAPVPFLMYPQAETADGRVDSLDADRFGYEVISREL